MDRGWSGRCSGSHASAGWDVIVVTGADLRSEAANVTSVAAYLDPCACKGEALPSFCDKDGFESS